MKHKIRNGKNGLRIALLVFASAASAVAQTTPNGAGTGLPIAQPVQSGAAKESESKIPGLQISEIPASLNSDGAVPVTTENIGATEGGLWLKDAPLNEVFQFLASRASLQFFHNTSLTGPQFMVTGQLLDQFDPLKQMEEIGLMYGVTIQQKGNTVYALTTAQENIMPGKPVHYQLRYLRPTDIEQIKGILNPFLTPGTGIAEFESKTNTIVIFDNEKKANQLLELLKELDQPKQQVAIETRILRVKSSSRNRIGVDWSTVLGDGIPLDAVANLNSLFNLPDLDSATRVLTFGTGTTGSAAETRTKNYSGSNLVLSPAQMKAVVSALNTGGLAQQESSPTLVIEDNEEGLISIVDRVPIIVNTITQTTVGQNVTEDVRYKIDPEDPYGDPATTREIGVSVAVTPTILPDDTIRMKLRPRASQIVEFIESKSGNLYPRVNESTVSTMARIPSGHSLFIGGFYEESQTEKNIKVPFFGDIPCANFLFKSDDKNKEMTSLVFIVTPCLYRPSFITENDCVTKQMKEIHTLPSNYDYPDRERPGFNHKRNMKNTWSGLFKKSRPEPPSSPLIPYTPPALQEDPNCPPSVEVRPLSERPTLGRGNIFQRSSR